MSSVEVYSALSGTVASGEVASYGDPLLVGFDGGTEHRAYLKFDTVDLVPEGDIVTKLELYLDRAGLQGSPTAWKHRVRFGQFLRNRIRRDAWGAPSSLSLAPKRWDPGIPRKSWVNLGPRAVELYWNSEQTDLEIADVSTGVGLMEIKKRKTRLRVSYATPANSLQILVCKRDVPGGDENYRWKPGLPVTIRPDTWTWGTQEDPNTSDKFCIITIPVFTKERAEPYLMQDHLVLDPHGAMVPERIRFFRFLLENLPNFAVDKLATTGRLTLTWAQIRNFCKNRRTGGTV